jgi:mono/diheme cytochrome c family protein
LIIMKARIFGVSLLTASALLTSSLSTTASAQQTGVYRYRDGKDIYEHVCQACHMPDAKGAVGAGMYPALASNPKLAAGLYPVIIILGGLKSMPSFAELDDEQIVALTNYLRTSFGNDYTDPVTLQQVKELRPTVVVRRRGRDG